MSRPWKINKRSWEAVQTLFPMWLKERGGIVVYENHMFDSSQFGNKSFLPAKFVAIEKDELVDAPDEYRPNDGLPSCRQQKVDVVRLEDFGGDVAKAMSCFELESEEVDCSVPA